MKKLLLLSFLILIALNHAFAQDQVAQDQAVEKKPSPVRFLISGAFEFGGDDVAKVFFTNGEEQSVKAGQGVSIALGAQFQFPKLEKLLLRTTVGYKYVTTQADNAHIRLTRVPLQFTANWMATDKIRLGAGLVTHQAIRFKADGIGEDMTFKSSSGPVFEVAYGIVGLSYTAMKYTDKTNTSYSANAIGITFSGAFPKR